MPRRAVSRTSAPFKEEGILTKTPFLRDVLALKVLTLYHARSAYDSERDGAAGIDLAGEGEEAGEEAGLCVFLEVVVLREEDEAARRESEDVAAEVAYDYPTVIAADEFGPYPRVRGRSDERLWGTRGKRVRVEFDHPDGAPGLPKVCIAPGEPKPPFRVATELHEVHDSVVVDEPGK